MVCFRALSVVGALITCGCSLGATRNDAEKAEQLVQDSLRPSIICDVEGEHNEHLYALTWWKITGQDQSGRCFEQPLLRLSSSNPADFSGDLNYSPAIIPASFSVYNGRGFSAANGAAIQAQFSVSNFTGFRVEGELSPITTKDTRPDFRISVMPTGAVGSLARSGLDVVRFSGCYVVSHEHVDQLLREAAEAAAAPPYGGVATVIQRDGTQRAGDATGPDLRSADSAVVPLVSELGTLPGLDLSEPDVSDSLRRWGPAERQILCAAALGSLTFDEQKAVYFKGLLDKVRSIYARVKEQSYAEYWLENSTNTYRVTSFEKTTRYVLSAMNEAFVRAFLESRQRSRSVLSYGRLREYVNGAELVKVRDTQSVSIPVNGTHAQISVFWLGYRRNFFVDTKLTYRRVEEGVPSDRWAISYEESFDKKRIGQIIPHLLQTLTLDAVVDRNHPGLLRKESKEDAYFNVPKHIFMATSSAHDVINNGYGGSAFQPHSGVVDEQGYYQEMVFRVADSGETVVDFVTRDVREISTRFVLAIGVNVPTDSRSERYVIVDYLWPEGLKEELAAPVAETLEVVANPTH